MALDVAKTLGKLLAEARRDEDAASIVAERATARVLFLEAAHRLALRDNADGGL